MSNPIVTFELENGEIMKGELYPDKAPNTVNNFIALANSGYYDGLIFHRDVYKRQAYVKAVHPGQHHVQQDQIRTAIESLIKAGVSIVCGDYGIALFL